MKYKLLLLDADGTLFDYDRAEGYALEQSFLELSLPFDNQVHLPDYRSINQKLWVDFELGRVTQAALRTERFEILFGKHGINVDVGGFSRLYLAHLGKGAFLTDGSEQICRYLAERYTLAILTNGIREVQFSRIGASPIAKYIRKIIVSEDAGFQKPDPRIFDYSLNAMQHDDKASVLMVGDSLSSDIKGGMNYGIDTCWYNPGGAPPREGIQPTYEIRALSDLKSIL